MIGKSRVVRDVLAEASSSHPQEFDVCPFITRCTLDVLCEAAMGDSLDAQRKPSSYIKAVERMTEILYGSIRPLLQHSLLNYLFGYGKEEMRCLSVMKKFTNSVIKQREKSISDKSLKTQSEEAEGECRGQANHVQK
jgi:cytochrome P450 family 4